MRRVLSPTPSVSLNLFVIPSLAQIAQRMVQTRVQAAAPARAAGLSLADIADASTRATAKNSLTSKSSAPRRIGSI